MQTRIYINIRRYTDIRYKTLLQFNTYLYFIYINLQYENISVEKTADTDIKLTYHNNRKSRTQTKCFIL